MKKSFLITAAFLLGIIILLWWSLKSKSDRVLDGKTELNVQLQWFDGAQFCGLYVAEYKKFFDEEDLKVNLIPINTYTSDPIALLTDGNADIAIAPSDQVLINKDKGKEIKVFGTVFNRSLACYMYKKSNLYDTLSLNDLSNKKIGVFKKFDTENILLTLIKKYSLEIDNKNIYQATGIDQFINNNVDVYGSYLINEPIEMRLNNIQTGYIDPYSYGVKFYSDTYITKNDFWNNKRGLLIKFLRAANKGWEYAKKNPEEAINIMFKMIKNKTKKEYYAKEKESLLETIKYIGDGENNWPAYMRREIWENIEKDLLSINRISQSGYINDLCDFEIIKKVYEK